MIGEKTKQFLGSTRGLNCVGFLGCVSILLGCLAVFEVVPAVFLAFAAAGWGLTIALSILSTCFWARRHLEGSWEDSLDG